MKNMRTDIITLALLLLTALILLSTCTRRMLEEDFMDTALIPVYIDWAESGVPVSEMHRASIWLYPTDGGKPIEYRMEGNLNYREIQVPVGVYSVLVFNETIDDGDWESITFTGADRYETFAAVGAKEEVRGFYSRSESLPLIKNSEPLAAWGLDRFEVTPDMAVRSRAVTNNAAIHRQLLMEEVPTLTEVKPLPRYERVVITAYVQNLASSMQATGTIDGMAAGVYMVSGQKIPTPAAHAFLLNGRVYDADNSNNGTTTRTFNIFGRLSTAEVRHKLNTDFLLTDGTLFPQEMFVQDDLITISHESAIKTYIINVGYDVQGEGSSIVLPGASAKVGIAVDSWDEVIVPLY